MANWILEDYNASDDVDFKEWLGNAKFEIGQQIKTALDWWEHTYESTYLREVDRLQVQYREAAQAYYN